MWPFKTKKNQLPQECWIGHEPCPDLSQRTLIGEISICCNCRQVMTTPAEIRVIPTAAGWPVAYPFTHCCGCYYFTLTVYKLPSGQLIQQEIAYSPHANGFWWGYVEGHPHEQTIKKMLNPPVGEGICAKKGNLGHWI